MIRPTLELEVTLWSQGYRLIVGIDEVGRGAWAGPLVAAGVILPQNFIKPKDLADSKLLKPRQREKVAQIIKKEAVTYYVSEVSASQIDRVGLARATNLLFRKIVKALSPDFCLIDAFYIKYFPKTKQMPVKNGDKICASIAAASILAKVHRDKIMKRLHFQYPNYGFGKHKGYGTILHQQAISTFGFSSVHRHSYRLDF